MKKPKSQTYRVGPNQGVAADPYHMVADTMPAAQETETMEDARTVSMLPIRSKTYKALDGRQLKWKRKMPAMMPKEHNPDAR